MTQPTIKIKIVKEYLSDVNNIVYCVYYVNDDSAFGKRAAYCQVDRNSFLDSLKDIDDEVEITAYFNNFEELVLGELYCDS